MTNTDHSAQRLQGCTYLGGAGIPFIEGERIDAFFDASDISIRGEKRSAKFSYVELAELAITGPGKVTTGGGFVGGGFGVEGALEGIALAAVLNALSTRTKINTFITAITNFGEIHLHYAGMEPGALRIALAAVFHRMRQADPVWIAARSKSIDAAEELPIDEQSELRARLLAPPQWPDPEAEAAFRRQEQEAEAALRKQGHDQHAQLEFERGPKGTCPNCERVIGLYVESCPHCKSDFGEGSSWQVRPI